jgi:hypothetical protein
MRVEVRDELIADPPGSAQVFMFETPEPTDGDGSVRIDMIARVTSKPNELTAYVDVNPLGDRTLRIWLKTSGDAEVTLDFIGGSAPKWTLTVPNDLISQPPQPHGPNGLLRYDFRRGNSRIERFELTAGSDATMVDGVIDAVFIIKDY